MFGNGDKRADVPDATAASSCALHSLIFLVNQANFIDCITASAALELIARRGLRGLRMLVDLRRYTIVPGQLKAYLQVYETYGLPMQRRHVRDPLSYSSPK